MLTTEKTYNALLIIVYVVAVRATHIFLKLILGTANMVLSTMAIMRKLYCKSLETRKVEAMSKMSNKCRKQVHLDNIKIS